jgi:enoyl-CoA hydratase/carnithine racemase
LLLTGEPFSPAHALAIGLVNRVVPHRELLNAADALARQIIRHPPGAVAAVITAATRGLNLSIDEGLLVERAQFAALVGRDELVRGLTEWRNRPRVVGQTG